MKETKIYCDHCGRELNEMHDYVEFLIDVGQEMECDLCADCQEHLEIMVKNFIKKNSIIK